MQLWNNDQNSELKINSANVRTPGVIEDDVFERHDELMTWKQIPCNYLCGRIPPVTSGSPSPPPPTGYQWIPLPPPQGPVTRCFDFFLNYSLNKMLNKYSNCQWIETPWSPYGISAILNPMQHKHKQGSETTYRHGFSRPHTLHSRLWRNRSTYESRWLCRSVWL